MSIDVEREFGIVIFYLYKQVFKKVRMTSLLKIYFFVKFTY